MICKLSNIGLLTFGLEHTGIAFIDIGSAKRWLEEDVGWFEGTLNLTVYYASFYLTRALRMRPMPKNSSVLSRCFSTVYEVTN